MLELTTNQNGLIAETAIIHEAVKLGIMVLRPVSDARYDLVLDLDQGFLRVQCKWATLHGDVIVVRCRTSRRGPAGHIHRGYQLGEIDAIAAYCAGTGQCYLLPLGLSVHRAAVQLRLKPARNNQQSGINWAEDFKFEATLRATPGPIAQLGER